MTRNARLGLIFFFAYAGVYLGFVLLNAFSPRTIERVQLAGVNLAVVYGLGLIGLAFVLSLVYGWICAADESGDNSDRSEPR